MNLRTGKRRPLNPPPVTICAFIARLGLIPLVRISKMAYTDVDQCRPLMMNGVLAGFKKRARINNTNANIIVDQPTYIAHYSACDIVHNKLFRRERSPLAPDGGLEIIINYLRSANRRQYFLFANTGNIGTLTTGTLFIRHLSLKQPALRRRYYWVKRQR